MSYLKQPDEPRYGLAVIDIFSKYADVQPISTKSTDSVYDALQKSFRIMGYPMSIYSDDDGGFKGKNKDFLKGKV